MNESNLVSGSSLNTKQNKYQSKHKNISIFEQQESSQREVERMGVGHIIWGGISIRYTVYVSSVTMPARQKRSELLAQRNQQPRILNYTIILLK